MKTHSVSCLILAGGQGKRMNSSDKGLVKFQGQPLVEHVINALQYQVDDFVISANRNIDAYQQFAPTVITDNDEKNGPLSGIASTLAACQHDLVLVVPCDMPNLPADLVKTLLDDLEHHDLSIAQVQQRMQLVFLMRKSLLTSVQQHLSSRNYRLMHWVKSCSPVTVDYSHIADSFRNINSVKDIDQP